MTNTTATTPTPAKKSTSRRTPQQIVADLEAKIARVHEREATKAVRAEPAVKLTVAAVRALNKALGEAEEPEMVEALKAATGALSTYLEGRGLRVPTTRHDRRKGAQVA